MRTNTKRVGYSLNIFYSWVTDTALNTAYITPVDTKFASNIPLGHVFFLAYLLQTLTEFLIQR